MIFARNAPNNNQKVQKVGRRIPANYSFERPQEKTGERSYIAVSDPPRLKAFHCNLILRYRTRTVDEDSCWFRARIRICRTDPDGADAQRTPIARKRSDQARSLADCADFADDPLCRRIRQYLHPAINTEGRAPN